MTMVLTFQFQIVIKTKPHSKANTVTKALKAVTKRQVFAISDKGGKDNDKAYDVQTFPVVIGRPPAASKRPLCQTIGRRMAHVACANIENAYAFRIHLVTVQQRCGYNSTTFT